MYATRTFFYFGGTKVNQQVYPSETAWWPTFEAQTQALYFQAKHIPTATSPPPDWSAFRWSARVAYDIAAGLTKEQSSAKHLAELKKELGLA